MRKEDILAFARRDWASVAEAKERYWAGRKSTMTPAEALRLGDALRTDAKAFGRGEPTASERAEDLATHDRVAEMLRRGETRRRR